MQLLLASTSPFRAAILQTLRLPFATARPEVDESPLAGEDPAQLVERLAVAKAQAVAADAGTFVIGSDQVATIDGDILGKPHTVERAVAQLMRFSGRRVQFRPLSEAAVRTYVALESPLNCAGSFKSEGLGILLFDALLGRDPNALIGLPLIALRGLFELHGVDLLAEIERAAQAG